MFRADTDAFALHQRQKNRRKFPRIMALFLSALLLTGGFFGKETILDPVRAHAVADGPGVQITIPGYGPHTVGAYLTGSGVKVYCLEIPRIVDRSVANPRFTTPGTIPGFHQPYYFAGDWQITDASVPALEKGSTNYAKLAYLLGMHGDTNNGVKAAALQIAVWEVRDIGASPGHHQLLSNYRAALPQNVNAMADALLAEATAWVASGGTIGSFASPVSVPAEPVIESANAYEGTIKVSKNTTEINISNAIFVSTETSKIVWPNGAPEGTSVSWQGTPPAGWDRNYSVSISGKWENPDGGLSIGDIRYSPGLIAPDGSITQAVGYGSNENKPSKGVFSGSSKDLDTLWSPVLTTQTPSDFVEVGHQFGDSVTFGVAPGSAEWRRNGKNGAVKFAPITAKGVLYGPFVADPSLTPSVSPPADAPIAGTATLTTSTEQGPGTYTVTPSITAAEAGYYSWVWDIVFEEQHPDVKNPSKSGNPSIPANYFFTDGFGQASEGQRVPMSPIISTQLDREIIRQSDPVVVDSVKIDIINGEWMNYPNDGSAQNTNAPIPVNIRLSVYGTQLPVVQQKDAPAEAEKVAQGFVTAAGAREAFLSDPITIPTSVFLEHEAITVQACIFKEDQPIDLRPFFNETCDDWGVPSESAELEWIPELTTHVNTEFIDVGDSFNDTVTFYVKGLSQEESKVRGWRKIAGTNDYQPVTARGKLYGPFDTNPTEFAAQEVPAYAANRVVATSTIVTSPELGPDTYDVLVPKALESGYYTWVWGIESDAQTDYVKKTIPNEYNFSDFFGAENESNIVSTTLKLKTQLTKSEIEISDLTIKDEVLAKLVDGQWLMVDGKRVPATVRLTVYGTEGEPMRQASAPESAVEIASTKVSINRQDKTVTSSEIKIPLQTGFMPFSGLTVQACILKEDQPENLRGYLKEVCDDWGVPEESAIFMKPEVTTLAQENAGLFTSIHDVAHVSGTNLPDGSTMDFTVFLKPELGQPKYDQDWNKILDEQGQTVLWSEDELEAAAKTCEVQPVGKTERIEVAKMGQYTSPEILAKSVGTVYWVEELFVVDSETGDEVSIHRGECGLPNETTIVEAPKVVTQAQGTGAVKGDIQDIAYVTGELPENGAEINFTLFLKPEVGTPKYDTDWQKITDEYGKDLLWAEDEINIQKDACEAQPVAQTKRVSVKGEGEYLSPAVKTESEGTIYWVEELITKDPISGEEILLHRGECGLPNETTLLTYPTVKTKAKEKVRAGGKLYDTAIVAGPLSEREEISYEVTFEAFHFDAKKQSNNQLPNNETPDSYDKSKYMNACTENTKVWESTLPTVVDRPGEFMSEKWRSNEEMLGEILWVETLWLVEETDQGVQRFKIHTGECGEEDEITKISEPVSLAETGNASLIGIMGSGILLILIGLGIFVSRLLTRQTRQIKP
ncbi:MAG TPA: hypothetical protein VLZ31_02220 [Microbacteriaceae bacterium]|nr:hypothetical protein [Microbacteriaceae bacterium]